MDYWEELVTEIAKNMTRAAVEEVREKDARLASEAFGLPLEVVRATLARG